MYACPMKPNHDAFLSLFRFHKELAPGTLKSILSDAGISPEELPKVI